MTELAYLADIPAAYIRSFRARVTALPPGAVVLDRTYLYPQGGGQPSDRGVLTGADGRSIEVTDVRRSGPSVLHRLRASGSAARTFPVGTEIAAEIDWPRRHRHMRLHTAQHLVSARIFERTGRRTRRAVLSGLTASVDLEAPIGATDIEALVEDVRARLARPRPVMIRWVPRREWERNPTSARSGLVALPPTVDPVRVVEIEELDACPCGGTHVGTTAEIGPLRIEPSGAGDPAGTRLTLTLEEPDRPTRTG